MLSKVIFIIITQDHEIENALLHQKTYFFAHFSEAPPSKKAQNISILIQNVIDQTTETCYNNSIEQKR